MKNRIYILFAVLIAFQLGCEEKIGLNSLTNITDEPKGANCPDGGVKIETGQDSNSNGILDENEVQQTSFVCHGGDGSDGSLSLFNISRESAGDNCDIGGLKIESGVDSNNNGTLDDGEITSTTYVCNGINGTNGNNSLTNITNETAGENCEYGGLKIESGLDINNNGALDIDEVTSTAYSCNGADGINGNNSLTNVINEPAGENCSNGGLRIETGQDLNNNGSLESDEIISTAYVCNGTDGIEGNNSLTTATNESPGQRCSGGGLKIETGLDTDNNGILDSDEITSTAYICNGINGSNTLTNITNETAGANCSNGGLKIESGLDSNNNGILEIQEITSTAYICNGIDGINGFNSITNVTNEPAGVNCDNGGLKIETGIDLNNNGLLDIDEINSTAYTCNGIDGIDGSNSLTNITNEPAGANCDNGGLKIETGTDTNNNGSLDIDEITSTSFVCNGIDGTDGSNTLTNVINEPAGGNCDNGGLKIESGLDSNNNGTLDTDEVTSTAYVCNGIILNTPLTRITNEAAGANCVSGGLKIDFGDDLNGNLILEDSEVLSTSYICNVLDGQLSLLNVSDEPAGTNCESGGIRIDSGIDDNGNGVLDDIEIESTTYICNGLNGGFDEQIRLKIELPLNNSTANEFWSSSTTYTSAGIGIIDFNKNNFTGVDSIVFTSNPGNFTENTRTYIELFDFTNNASVSNSEISIVAGYNEDNYIFSNNIFESLPNSTISLGIRLRSEVAGNTACSGFPYLILYRSR